MKNDNTKTDKNISAEELAKIQLDTESLVGKIKKASSDGEKGIYLTVQETQVVTLLQKIFFTYLKVVNVLHNSKKAVKKLKHLLFGNHSEKSKDRTNNKNNDDNSDDDDKDDSGAGGKSIGNNPSIPPKGDGEKKTRQGGGGKNGIDKYTGALDIHCPLPEDLRPGEICPECKGHNLYIKDQKQSLRLIGMAPVTALRFAQDVSGCVCGAKFTGEAPKELQPVFVEEKYTSSALSSMIHLKFNMGMSYGGIADFQQTIECPLPASTQSNKIKKTMPIFNAVFNSLLGNAVNRDIVGFDDTTHIILEGRTTKKGHRSRNGYASVFAFRNIGNNERNIVIYTVNFNHAGKDFFSFLGMRDPSLEPLIAISDGLPAYGPYKKETAGANCNVHARRQFINEDPECENYLCNTIVKNYKTIYKNEGFCSDSGFTPEERLAFHQEHSQPVLNKIFDLCKFMMMSPKDDLGDIKSRLELPDYIIPAEPNSNLYNAAKYFIDREQQLGLFLEKKGVPLDTNLEERKIKKVIKLEKQSLFFKTLESAKDGGVILSLIETAKEYVGNSFEYIEFLIANGKDVMENPDKFLPWNYQVHSKYRVKPPLFSNLVQMMRTLGSRFS